MSLPVNKWVLLEYLAGNVELFKEISEQMIMHIHEVNKLRFIRAVKSNWGYGRGRDTAGTRDGKCRVLHDSPWPGVPLGEGGEGRQVDT